MFIFLPFEKQWTEMCSYSDLRIYLGSNNCLTHLCRVLNSNSQLHIRQADHTIQVLEHAWETHMGERHSALKCPFFSLPANACYHQLHSWSSQCPLAASYIDWRWVTPKALSSLSLHRSDENFHQPGFWSGMVDLRKYKWLHAQVSRASWSQGTISFGGGIRNN